MCRAILLIAACATLQAHVVSTSSGELRIEGANATYEIRIPAYEVEHVTNPQTELLAEVWFERAQQTSSQCAIESDEYVCRASYTFDPPPADTLNAQITLFRATVPNHIHFLTATIGDNTAQEIFDQVTPLRELRFRPRSFAEQLWRDATDGARRLLISVSGLLFLVALALTFRTRTEAVGLSLAFLAGEWAVRPIARLLPTGFSPEFLEAAMALTVAYLAAEVLWLPQGRARWAIVPVLGLIHGLAFAPYPPGHLIGANVAQAAILALLAAGVLGAFRQDDLWRKRLAGVLLAAGLAWFAHGMIA